MARFDNKVVLVSGGARGQGAAEARLLVAQGAKVVIGDVLDNQGQALAVELGPAASFVRHDVTSGADWARAVETAQKLGGLHSLVPTPSRHSIQSCDGRSGSGAISPATRRQQSS